MNSGSSQDSEDYYGFGSGPSSSGKEIRKMRRTQLSRQKKSNHSGKSISSERDSSLSNNKKSRQIHQISPETHKNDILSSLEDSKQKLGQNNHPSSTDLQNITSPSIRKSRLQINAGVFGIKMSSLSPNNILSHPSKVLIVNESSYARKGSKSNHQRSIVYVEYNNFMTELNKNKNLKGTQKHDFKPYEQNMQPQQSKNLQKASPTKKKLGSDSPNQLLSNFDNEYFFGINRNFTSPVLGVFDKIEAEKKNQASGADLSITSIRKNRLQSSKLAGISPKVPKTQKSQIYFKPSKSKISIRDIDVLKGKNHQQFSKLNSPTRESRGSVKSAKSTKFENYGIQVNIAENVFPKYKKQVQIQEIKKEYLISPNPILTSSSQKNIKFDHSQNQNKSQLQKQLTLIKSRSLAEPQQIKTEHSQLNNPYNLAKNKDLVNKYQKKKQAQVQDLVGEIRGKSPQNYTQVQGSLHSNQFDSQIARANQKQFESNDSQSITSNNSSRRAKRLIKARSNDIKSQDSKTSIKCSQSKSKMLQSPKVSRTNIFEPKTTQSHSHYKNASFGQKQGHENSQNQAKSKGRYEYSLNPIKDIESQVSQGSIKMHQTRRQRQIDEYNSVYYTPNPYNFKNSKQASPSDSLNLAPNYEKSSIVSDQHSDFSQTHKSGLQSQFSSMKSDNEKLSIKNDKNQNVVSSSKLKRENLVQKSKLRVSRNSFKSNQSRNSKRILLKPGSKKESSLQNSIHQQKIQQNQSIDRSKFSLKVEEKTSNVNCQILSNQIERSMENVCLQHKQTKLEEKTQKNASQGIKFLRAVKIERSVKIAQLSSFHTIKDEDSQINLLKLPPNRQGVKNQSNVQKSQASVGQNLKQESNLDLKNSLSESGQKRQINSTDKKASFKFQFENQQKNGNSVEDLSRTSFEVEQDQSSIEENYYNNTLNAKEIKIKMKEQPSELLLQDKVTDTFNQTTKQNQQNQQHKSSKKQYILEPKSPNDQSLSDLQNSVYSAQSIKGSSNPQTIKKSIQAKNDNSQSPQMIFSKQIKSSISVKSGRNLKPLNLQNPTIQDFLTYLDEHDIAIGFLYLYIENTSMFYCSDQDDHNAPKAQQFVIQMKKLKSKRYDEKYEKLTFLVLKKYLYQKNRIVRCLRGLESNIFNLTGLEIPQKILKKFINHEQTKEKLKQFETETKELFKELEQKYRYLRLKPQNKKDKLIKLQTPYDNFTRDIVGMLVQQLNQITTDIDEMEIKTGSKLSSSNPSFPFGTKQGYRSVASVIAKEILSNESRGLQIMEIVFLLSELNGRKVKKCELLNISEIDFELFYERNIDKLLVTYEYFEGVKYPSDNVVKKEK